MKKVSAWPSPHSPVLGPSLPNSWQASDRHPGPQGYRISKQSAFTAPRGQLLPASGFRGSGWPWDPAISPSRGTALVPILRPHFPDGQPVSSFKWGRGLISLRVSRTTDGNLLTLRDLRGLNCSPTEKAFSKIRKHTDSSTHRNCWQLCFQPRRSKKKLTTYFCRLGSFKSIFRSFS